MSLLSFLPLIGNVIDRIIPDKNAAEKAKRELEVLEQSGELQIILGQLKVNQQEAGNKSMFVAGWRPFIGWVCGAAFAYHYIGLPIITFVAAAQGIIIDLPVFDMSSLLTVLLGMLGLGGLRTFEKYKGVARRTMRD